MTTACLCVCLFVCLFVCLCVCVCVCVCVCLCAYINELVRKWWHQDFKSGVGVLGAEQGESPDIMYCAMNQYWLQLNRNWGQGWLGGGGGGADI